jgi:hypothetical protein
LELGGGEDGGAPGAEARRKRGQHQLFARSTWTTYLTAASALGELSPRVRAKTISARPTRRARKTATTLGPTSASDT